MRLLRLRPPGLHPATADRRPGARGRRGSGNDGGRHPRRARIGQACIEAVWLGRRVSDVLAARVGNRYPTVLIYRDRAALFSDFPLTDLDCFRSPGSATGGGGPATQRWVGCWQPPRWLAALVTRPRPGRAARSGSRWC